MTAKEKAKELINKFNHVNSKNYIDDNGLWDTEFVLTNDDAKECALIAVDEIILSAPFEPVDTDWDEAGSSAQYWYPQKLEDSAKWWAEVKKEIEKL